MKAFKLEALSQSEMSFITGGTDDKNKYVVRTIQETQMNADGSITVITTIFYSDGSFKQETITSMPVTTPGGTARP